MKLSEMEAAINEAKAELARADEMTGRMVSLIVGRLRTVNGYWNRKDLAKLKKELQNFDARKRVWKEEK